MSRAHCAKIVPETAVDPSATVRRLQSSRHSERRERTSAEASGSLTLRADHVSRPPPTIVGGIDISRRNKQSGPRPKVTRRRPSARGHGAATDPPVPAFPLSRRSLPHAASHGVTWHAPPVGHFAALCRLPGPFGKPIVGRRRLETGEAFHQRLLRRPQ